LKALIILIGKPHKIATDGSIGAHPEIQGRELRRNFGGLLARAQHEQ
jgi:hypothetical protein